MLLVDIIDDSFQTVEHPLRVVISDLHILTAPVPVELDDTPQLHPGADPVHLPILGKPYPGLSARTVDPYLDQICIPPLYKDVSRHIVDDSAVDIASAVLHGLIFEAQKICACQEKILQPSLRDLLDAQLQLLQICQRKGHDTELSAAVPDLRFVHILMDQLPQRTHIHAAVPEDPPQLCEDIRKLLLSLEELLHPVVIH